MIPAEDALREAKKHPPRSLERRELTDEELVALGYIDYNLEQGIFNGFNGEPFEIDIPVEIARSEQVIAALKQRYEDGRWTVAVFPRCAETGEVKSFHMVFCPKEVVQLSDKPVLPVVMGYVPPQVLPEPELSRILVRMPTRGRPAQAIEVLGKYRMMAGMPIQVEVVVDTDDETVTSEFLYRLSRLGCTVVYGEHKSKIEACNDGRIQDWDVLVLASDDMVPAKDGWARRIAELFEEHYPHFDGTLHLDDGYAHDRVATLSVMGRRYYEMLGYEVYHPAYKSLFCDDHHTEIARLLRRITYVPEIIIEHKHPATGKARVDALYSRNDKLWSEDERTFKQFKAINFNVQQPLLSILICTFSQRREMLSRLLDALYDQARLCSHEVEIIYDHKPANSLGDKRQRLLDRSRGKFICFVDDDDMVSHDYVKRVTDALASDPEADCASFVGVMTTNGDRPQRFEHSLKYNVWRTAESGLLERSPNHLNAVRRSIAVEAGFGGLTYTEDHFFSKAIKPRLNKEVSIGDEPIYFYFFEKRTPHQGSVK